RKIFDQVKGEGVRGPYNWEGHLASIQTAQNVFGTGNVATHFIVGLGETEQEMLQAIQDVHDLGVTVSLFAFTPVKGTAEQYREQPPLAQYRKMQFGRELVVNWEKRVDSFSFLPDGGLEAFNIPEGEFRNIMDAGTAFETRGCPNCNRPYYDSHPGGAIYNFAALLTEEQKLEVQNILEPFR
ncbi:MAG TPA: radical SAM protein, partial [Candidatus Lokiarchaeia archaeon]|nr:radical SAM protein [Candidatus Lokiarchaeia archaeon]